MFQIFEDGNPVLDYFMRLISEYIGYGTNPTGVFVHGAVIQAFYVGLGIVFIVRIDHRQFFVNFQCVTTIGVVLSKGMRFYCLANPNDIRAIKR